MDIIRDNQAYTLSISELREASQEFGHLCLMQRIVSYLAAYYDLPLSSKALTEACKSRLSDFYDTYHLPFQLVIDSAYGKDAEELANCPDQVYLFLSSLAQSYEQDEFYQSMSEEEAFRKMFESRQEKLNDEVQTRRINLGIFSQFGEKMLLCDPTVNKDSPLVCWINDAMPGLWTTAVQEVVLPNSNEEQRVAFLLAKYIDCPYTFQQMMEQVFYWPQLESGVFTENGVIGLFDEKYYQEPTSLGIPPINKARDRWVEYCIDLTLDYPYAGIMPHNVISSTGEGEGQYDVYYLMDDKKKVIAIAVDFLLYGV